jgi:hypothetical protein
LELIDEADGFSIWYAEAPIHRTWLTEFTTESEGWAQGYWKDRLGVVLGMGRT